MLERRNKYYKNIYKTEDKFERKFIIKMIFSQKENKIHNSYVFVPNKAEKILKLHYGNNVFDVIFEKLQENTVVIYQKFTI